MISLVQSLSTVSSVVTQAGGADVSAKRNGRLVDASLEFWLLVIFFLLGLRYSVLGLASREIDLFATGWHIFLLILVVEKFLVVLILNLLIILVVLISPGLDIE